MHVYFLGISGAGIGPLALIAHQAGYEVSGSDKQDSNYLRYLKEHGITEISIGSSDEHIAGVHAANPIDWVVYSSAVPKEQPDHPILKFAESQGIRSTKRDEFLNELLTQKNLKLIAVAGTHGKTTTTAMVVWLFKQLGVPISYSVGGKLSFGDMGEFDPKSEYFVYECDEYDRNFLSFNPYLSLLSGIDWDHPDIFPTREDYYSAFQQFVDQSVTVIAWQIDIDKARLSGSQLIGLAEQPPGLASLKLAGEVNRRNARLSMQALAEITDEDLGILAEIMNKFPGVSRRFEQLTTNIYSDYAHTPDKIRGALQLAHETAGENVVVVYEGLHNTRQHFIKDDLVHLFDSVKKLYVVPSYRAREDESLEDLTPEKIIALTAHPEKAEPVSMDEHLLAKIKNHADNGDLVLCLTAGGGASLDEWLRLALK